MTDMADHSPRSASTVNGMIATLRELISALDRRVPHAGRPGERRIAQDAQTLRLQAVARIEALRRQQPYDQELADAIMTDDGSPLPEPQTNLRAGADLGELEARNMPGQRRVSITDVPLAAAGRAPRKQS